MGCHECAAITSPYDLQEASRYMRARRNRSSAPAARMAHLAKRGSEASKRHLRRGRNVDGQSKTKVWSDPLHHA